METLSIVTLLVVFSAICVDSKSYIYKTTDANNRTFATKCIEGLDCFYTGYPWFDPPRRMASLIPEDCEDIVYNLYTPKNKYEAFEMDADPLSILNSPFNISLPTQFYIHAYWANEKSLEREMVKKDAVLEGHDYNVIVPDFREYAQPPYLRSIANIRVIAARIAEFIRQLMKVTGIKPQSIHLVGFSLGCQTAGYIGKRVPDIGRITALSPAGRNFIGTDPETRLVPSDALFVDVIQTSGDGDYGIQELDGERHSGHQNFLVNNARRQPGCSWVGKTSYNFLNFVKDFPETYCDHIRSNTLWMESTRRNDCFFKAVKCKSYEEFSSGECNAENSPVVFFGLQAKPVPGIGPEDALFMDTGTYPPYCDKDNVVPRSLRENDIFER